MTNNGGTLRGVSWRDLCPWLVIFRSFGIAVSLPVLLLALLGTLITPVGWWISGWVFTTASDGEAIRAIVEANSTCPCVPHPALVFSLNEPGSLISAMPAVWHQRFVLPFEMLFRVNLSLSEFSCLLMGGLFTLLVWAFFGSAIARIAIVQLGLEERVSLKDALALACRKWASCIAAPILPLLGVFVVALASGAWLGLIMIFNVGTIIGGLLWIVALIGGFVMSILLLGLLFGWPLMWTAISAEGSDAFDGLSRAYAYTFQRPLHYIFYAVLASAFGLLCITFVFLFSEGVIQLTHWSVSWGTNLPDLFASQTAETASVETAPADDRLTRMQEIMLAERYHELGVEPEEDVSTPLVIGTWLIYAVNGLVRALATAFTYSYFWCAMSAIYLLLRRDVDQTEFDEIPIDEDDESMTRPEVTVDESGVPQLAEESQESSAPQSDDQREAGTTEDESETE